MLNVSMLEERRRSMSIRLYGLDHAREFLPLAELDEIAQVLRDTLGADGAGVNLLVDDHQVTVGTTGCPVPPMHRSQSICSTVIGAYPHADLVELPDMSEVPALADNPFVDGSIARFRFYAAAPLVGKHGLTLGTLCAWGQERRTLAEPQRVILRHLGRAVVNVLDERRRELVPDAVGALRPAR